MAAMVQMGPEQRDPVNEARTFLLERAAQLLEIEIATLRGTLVHSQLERDMVADVAAQIRRLKR